MTRSNVSQIVTRKPFKITRNHPQITRKHIRKMGPVMPPIPYIWVSQVSPKIWVLLLLPKLRVVSVVSWSSCRSATHPPANAILRYREYQQVTAVSAPASSTGKYFSRSPSVVENGDGMPATQELWFVCCAYPRR